MKTYDVAIIGGGASGLVAAITAARRGKSAIILEKNKILGRKILSTGNGRCNFTNRFMKATCYNLESDEDKAFVDSVLGRFGCMEIIRFFDELGIIPKYNNDLVYPMTNQATTVVAVLEKEIERLGVDVCTEFDCKTISCDENDDFIVKSEIAEVRAKKVIASFGGKAAPTLGTDGSGNKLLRSLGHTVSFTYPALVGLKSNDSRLTKLAGLRCQGAVTLVIDGQNIVREEGEIQFNKDGISGFPVMQLSGKASKALAEHKVELAIDFASFLTDEQLANYMGEHQNFIGILPAQVLDLQLDIDTVKECVFEIFDTYGFNQAQVTAGGVPLCEVNPVTMESRICKNLYLTGELLDVDGRCGGYNLTFAFSTGIIAGQNV